METLPAGEAIDFALRKVLYKDNGEKRTKFEIINSAMWPLFEMNSFEDLASWKKERNTANLAEQILSYQFLLKTIGWLESLSPSILQIQLWDFMIPNIRNGHLKFNSCFRSPSISPLNKQYTLSYQALTRMMVTTVDLSQFWIFIYNIMANSFVKI